jgi:hypothetical protein
MGTFGQVIEFRTGQRQRQRIARGCDGDVPAGLQYPVSRIIRHRSRSAASFGCVTDTLPTIGVSVLSRTRGARGLAYCAPVYRLAQDRNGLWDGSLRNARPQAFLRRGEERPRIKPFGCPTLPSSPHRVDPRKQLPLQPLAHAPRVRLERQMEEVGTDHEHQEHRHEDEVMRHDVG